MLDTGLGSQSSVLENLNLDSFGVDQIKATKDLLDLDLQELSNEVDGLETLAKQMESLTFTDMIDDGLILDKKPKKRSKNGRKKRKQASKFSQMLQSPSNTASTATSGGGGSVTLCQLMNICDSVPMSSSVIEEKEHMMPFASSQRHQLIVDAPDSMTSDTNVDFVVVGNKTLEKAARMEDVSFEHGVSPHREIDFSQGVLVRGNQEKSNPR